LHRSSATSIQAGNGLRNRVPPHATTQDWLILILILTTVVAQRIIVAGPLAIGPRLGLLAVAVAAHLLALLRRRASLSSLEHGRSRRGRVLLCARCTFQRA
jgi:hypothetical protein